MSVDTIWHAKRRPDEFFGFEDDDGVSDPDELIRVRKAEQTAWDQMNSKLSIRQRIELWLSFDGIWVPK